MPADVAVIGEVALSGDIRPVSHIAQRVTEAAASATAASSCHRLHRPADPLPPGVAVVELAHLSRALESLAAKAPPATAG
jgi:predicted ATP-dependent serine protease